MSINKRKIVAYDDIEESADAKRLRYEGYNYGTQQRPHVGASPLQGQPEPVAAESFEEEVDDWDEHARGAAQVQPDAQTDGHARGQQKSQGRGDKWPDPTTGMRAFIPGLDDDGVQSDQDEETVDALAYLRSVRHEASGIPDLLVAPHGAADDGDEETSTEEVDTSGHGYYADGAYVCAPPMGPTLPVPTSSTVSAQDAHRRRLLIQFASLRRTLRTKPGPVALGTLPATHVPAPYPAADAAKKHWIHTLRAVDPRPRQLAHMETATVLRLLRLCQGMLRRRRNIDVRLSAWLWSLLARLPDVGTLGSEEVAVVRDLGKRAVWVHLGWQDAAIAAATAEQYDDAEGGEVQGEAVAAADENTRATLEMILTLAGEVYGQKDLLEFRERWTEKGTG